MRTSVHALGAMTALLLGSAVISGGCSADKTDGAGVDEDFAELKGAAPGGKADAFENMIVGSLAYGERSQEIRYRFPPRYRIFKFAADTGDVVTATVASSNGDALAWILDDSLVAIGFNDDASRTTFDAVIELEIPAHPSRTHYVVFREYFHDAARFTVTLDGIPAAPVEEIACGGFRGTGAVACPAGYQCRGAALAWDGTGKCYQSCGGFAGFMCDGGLDCIDDPVDDCSPATGGADCGGICVEGDVASCELVGCPPDGSSCTNCFGGWTCLPEGRVCAF